MMIHVFLMGWKPGISRELMDEAMIRRSQWEPPAAAKVLGEYWLSCPSPTVICIVEADSFEALFEIEMTWGDVFDITVVPATTPDEGLRLGQQFMANRPQ